MSTFPYIKFQWSLEILIWLVKQGLAESMKQIRPHLVTQLSTGADLMNTTDESIHPPRDNIIIVLHDT